MSSNHIDLIDIIKNRFSNFDYRVTENSIRWGISVNPKLELVKQIDLYLEDHHSCTIYIDNTHHIDICSRYANRTEHRLNLYNPKDTLKFEEILNKIEYQAKCRNSGLLKQFIYWLEYRGNQRGIHRSRSD